MLGAVMGKVKMTISVPKETAEYLRSTPNASAVVSEAVEVYRASELERELESAYEQDRTEAERLNREWEAAVAEVEA